MSIDLVDDVFKSWDILGMEEQKALQSFYKSKLLPAGTFAEEMVMLNNYIQKDGPVSLCAFYYNTPIWSSSAIFKKRLGSSLSWTKFVTSEKF